MNRMLTKWSFTAVLGVSMLAAPQAHADMNSAFNLYQGKNYKQAAVELYEVMQRDPSLPNRQQAEFLLARSLEAQGYYIPALVFYANVFKTGKSHPSQQEAAAQLVTLAKTLHDDFVVPAIINQRYDADFETLAKLDADRINSINYMVGVLSYRVGKDDDAAQNLQAVQGDLAAKARYLQGVIRIRKNDNEGAIALFKQVIESISPEDENEDRMNARNLAILGTARAHYALGRFKESAETYAQVPRFSKQWFDAIFESSWAYFQTEDYGRALGAIESVLSPYFNKRFRAEAYVLGAMIYYSNCQFDRTRSMLEAFKGRYEPALKQLNDYLASGRKDEEYYRDVVASSANLPLEIVRQIRRNGRFLNYHRLLTELNREQEMLSRADNWRNAALKGELENILKDQKEQFEEGTGRWSKSLLSTQKDILTQFVNQATIIKFETATSEKEILEAGGDVAGKQRKRLPRPDIPNDQYQHWNYRGEYWSDEIGFYVHGVRKECSELGVAAQ